MSNPVVSQAVRRPLTAGSLAWGVLALTFQTGIVFGQAAETTKPLLHPLFSENAVLQRDRPVPIWGWTRPNAEVTVKFDGKGRQARADQNGRWTITLGSHGAGGPHSLTVTGTAKGESEVRENLLFGDVWLCSGQSNMAYDLKSVTNYQAEAAAANFPEIRLLKVPGEVRAEPADTFKASSWQLCSPETVIPFSATAYFFGRKLYQELKVPIGLVNSSWSGTPGEAWVSAPALAALPEFTPRVEELKAKGNPRDAYNAELIAWWKKNDPGTAAGQRAADFDDSKWQTMDLPGPWEGKGFADFDGVMWFRRTVEVPANWAGKDLELDLDTLDDNDTTYWNGVEIGSTEGFTDSRAYPVPGSGVKAGTNVISVRILDLKGGGGFSGKTLALKNGKDSVRLDGAWKFKQGPDVKNLSPAPKYKADANTPTVLFNGKIAPLMPAAFKGVIWYQGESNADNAAEAAQYRKLLPVLVKDWRTHFGATLPFYIMQLANFKEQDDEPRDAPWPNVRDAQLQTSQRLPNTYLTVITDLGDAKNIHFPNKQDAGARMAINVLGNTYGKAIEFSGPTLRASQPGKGSFQMVFDHAQGLNLKGDVDRVFALAGADGKFHWAKAEISGNKITLSSPEVAQPERARFGWANNPRASLYNSAGLPASPFQVPAAAE